MMTISEQMKVRIKCSLDEAIEHAKQWGGWIVRRDNGQVYWYSMAYTTEMIMTELPGNLTVGGWSEFTRGENVIN